MSQENGLNRLEEVDYSGLVFDLAVEAQGMCRLVDGYSADMVEPLVSDPTFSDVTKLGSLMLLEITAARLRRGESLSGRPGDYVNAVLYRRYGHGIDPYARFAAAFGN